jgi:hypothetical protein
MVPSARVLQSDPIGLKTPTLQEAKTVENQRTFRVYDWIGRHVRWMSAGVLFVALGLGVVGPMIANTEEPSFNPDSELFATFEDLLSTNTDFVQSLERVNTHFPSSGEGSSLIFIEGDITDPEPRGNRRCRLRDSFE